MIESNMTDKQKFMNEALKEAKRKNYSIKIEAVSTFDDALKKLADSTKDYNYTPPERSAMCKLSRWKELKGQT